MRTVLIGAFDLEGLIELWPILVMQRQWNSKSVDGEYPALALKI